MMLGDAGITAVMGYAIVFLGIVLLMTVVVLMGRIMVASRSKAAPVAPAKAAPTAPAVAKPQGKPAPGTAGELKLYGTDPKTAAMVMAIVADKMGKPLNELRFRSIREITED